MDTDTILISSLGLNALLFLILIALLNSVISMSSKISRLQNHILDLEWLMRRTLSSDDSAGGPFGGMVLLLIFIVLLLWLTHLLGFWS